MQPIGLPVLNLARNLKENTNLYLKKFDGSTELVRRKNEEYVLTVRKKVARSVGLNHLILTK
jgi:hypothetical protein